jgi:hypothetical protein
MDTQEEAAAEGLRILDAAEPLRKLAYTMINLRHFCQD